MPTGWTASWVVATAIPYTIASRHVVNLKDSCAQGTYIIYKLVVATVDTIKTKAQAHHLHLTLWEMLYAGAVAHVAQNLMVEG